jgi:hypothetical protein
MFFIFNMRLRGRKRKVRRPTLLAGFYHQPQPLNGNDAGPDEEVNGGGINSRSIDGFAGGLRQTLLELGRCADMIKCKSSSSNVEHLSI